MTKIIFLDIDGTLVSFNTHQVPESAKAALRDLRKKGVKLVIATGRSYPETAFLKEQLDFDFDAYITLNGQLCYHDGQVIHSQSIPRTALEGVLPLLEEKQLSCVFVEEDYSYLNRVTPSVLEVGELLGDTVDATPVDSTNRIYDHEVYQLAIYAEESEEAEFFSLLPSCKPARWNPRFADVIPVDGGKVSGIQAVLAYFGLSQADSMAFGDGGNDIDMLKYAAIGIAMGNAADEVKQAADYITTHVDENGVAAALHHFGLL